MKVTHISSSNIYSGSGRAAYRIHTALKEAGVDSRLLVLNKFSDDRDTKTVTDTWAQKILKKVRPRYEKAILNLYKRREKKPFSIASRGINITKEKAVKDSDIINLHWINKSFLSLKSIKQIGKLNKPIVWTLHDMWAFTGGCHYSNGCIGYENLCGQCPILGSKKSNDLSREILSRKISVFKDLNLTIVTPSNWLADCARKSTLFKNSKIEVIPYPIDTKIFKPVGKDTARKILNLPERKLLVLFSISPTASKERKGINSLIESLLFIERKYPKLAGKTELLIMGINRFDKIERLSFKVHFLGVLYDDITISLYYNAADIFILPSTEDNLPNTVIESLSCGTPALGFKVGGVPDIISHKKNGYLAEPHNIEDLEEGLNWVLEDKNKLARLEKNAREKVLKNYTYEIIGQKYLDLYESLLK